MTKNKRDLISPRRITKIRRSLEPKAHSANFKVVVRVRPRNTKEVNCNSKCIIDIVNTNSIIFDPKENDQPFFYQGVQQVHSRDYRKKANKNLPFSFDTIFGPEADNDEVFCGSTKNLMESLMKGYNCSVFVYGATGAGKTHTMIGHNNNPGITYLTMKELFDQMEILKIEKDFHLSVTYLEVYNETVNDLLNPREPLHVREDGKYGVCVAGLTVKAIKCPTELFDILQKGNANRTQHPTDANSESSRSHAVFQVYIQMTNRLTCEKSHAKLSMIDLAGSERGAATGCKGMRFTEGANINKSLLALGNCINSLADGHRHVPYRDSKLTRLLKDSLGGNCQTVMIANISPSHLNYEDTYNTLKYANRAKKIKSDIKKNITKTELTTAQYAKVVEGLNKKIAALEKELQEKNKVNICSCKKLNDVNSPRQQVKLTPKPASPKHTITKQDQSETKEEWIENLKRYYDEKDVVERQILRLENDEKIIDLKKKFKEMTENKFQKLCIDNDNLEKGVNKIQSTVGSLIQKNASIKMKLNDLEVHKSSLERLIRHELLNKEDPFAAQNEIAQKWSHLQKNVLIKLTDFFEKEIECRDKIEDRMAELLKYYFTLLSGYEHVTREMRNDYNGILDLVQGVRHVTWENPENLTRVEERINLNETVVVSSSDDVFEPAKTPSVKRKLYSETTDTEEEECRNLNSTFDVVEVKCNKPKIVKPIRTGNGIKKTKVSALNILGRDNSTTTKKFVPTNRVQKFPLRKVPTILEGGIKKTARLRRSLITASKENKNIVKKKIPAAEVKPRLPLTPSNKNLKINK